MLLLLLLLLGILVNIDGHVQTSEHVVLLRCGNIWNAHGGRCLKNWSFLHPIGTGHLVIKCAHHRVLKVLSILEGLLLELLILGLLHLVLA